VAGITVVGVASTGEAAVRRVSELCPDVTLVDIDLCGASGLELARHLTEACGGAAGSVILISAHPEEEFTDLIEACPAADHVDWHQVAKLVQRGCPPQLALRIVR
jgi:DNA-binding NarL/FixJ family response regulator